MIAVSEPFLKIRADDFAPESVYNEFIVPPFKNWINVLRHPRSVRIMGGRGCGKTMFVRYFGHQSWLSLERTGLTDEDARNIGLYFRPDTEFCGLLSTEWLGKQEARLAFSHYVALNLLADACSAVESISRANFADGQIVMGDPLIDRGLASLLDLTDPNLSSLRDVIEMRQVELESWVRNPKRAPQPKFVSFATVLPRLASDLERANPRLKGLAFKAFIDEFENLAASHREIICDAIKHRRPQLVVHIAHKKEAVNDFKTSSDERVVEIHDLNTYDLEGEFSDTNVFKLVAAELLLLRLHQAGRSFDCPAFDPQKLHDVRDLAYRAPASYRDQVLKCVQTILPTPTAAEISVGVMSDGPLRRRLTEMITKGLMLHRATARYKAADLIKDDNPANAQASIVLGALLNRKTQDVDALVSEFNNATGGAHTGPDPFFKVGGWIDNNLRGCLFHLYAGLPRRSNINYAGFDRFCALADPNLRFFQALCHATLRLAGQDFAILGELRQQPIDIEVQADAAKVVSEDVFADVFQLGSNGAHLLELAGRLGKLFQAYNRRASQSEPEINHFSIKASDREKLTPEAEALLRQAKIWSVLYEEQDTKNKSDYDIAATDLILNPIYAPHFRISYRKRRKVTLQAGHVEVILRHSPAQFEMLLKELVDPSDMAPDNDELF